MKAYSLLRSIFALLALALSVVPPRGFAAATPEITVVLDAVTFDNSQVPAGWQTAPTSVGTRDFTGARMNVHPTDSIHYITRTVSVPATATKLTLTYRANMVATNEPGENTATAVFADGDAHGLSDGFSPGVHDVAWVAESPSGTSWSHAFRCELMQVSVRSRMRRFLEVAAMDSEDGAVRLPCLLSGPRRLV